MDQPISHLGLLDDEEIVLDDAALALAALDHPGVALSSYESLIAEMAGRILDLGDGAATAAEQAEVLARVVGGEHGFGGDTETYDDPANADLIAVIDRRRGLPVALAILWVTLARRVGWEAEALNTPAHVLVRIGGSAADVLVDPFAGGVLVAPDAVTALLARAGSRGRMTPLARFEALSNRGVLTRLLSNQAERARAGGQLSRALTLYERMTAVAPATAGLWWARASLERQAGRQDAARASLGAILETTRDPAVRARVLAAIADA